MKPYNRLWLALMESKLAIALFAGLFVGAVVLLFVPPQFLVHGDNGELLWRIAKLVSCGLLHEICREMRYALCAGADRNQRIISSLLIATPSVFGA